MATIGLDNLYYATVTEAPETGYETYGTPTRLSKAISAELTFNTASATLYADDAAADVFNAASGGTITLGTRDISPAVFSALLGATIDDNGVIVQASEDAANYVAIGFRSQKSDGHYMYVWIYRVKFSAPGMTHNTKADSIAFDTPSIEGAFVRRNKPTEISADNHPFLSKVSDNDTGVDAGTISGWFTQVYEPAAGE
jgi:phi13 family phage major tail protein